MVSAVERSVIDAGHCPARIFLSVPGAIAQGSDEIWELIETYAMAPEEALNEDE